MGGRFGVPGKLGKKDGVFTKWLAEKDELVELGAF